MEESVQEQNEIKVSPKIFFLAGKPQESYLESGKIRFGFRLDFFLLTNFLRHPSIICLINLLS